MGSATSSMLSKMVYGRKPRRIVMGGLSNGGKTIILHRLKHNHFINDNVATIGFNIEDVEYSEIDFQILDVGQQNTRDDGWRIHCWSAQALVFVVDCNDKERIMEAKDELYLMLNKRELRKEAPLLVYANKQDLPNAMSPSEITLILDLHSLYPRLWHIEGSSAITGKGLHEGMDWLSTKISSKAYYDDLPEKKIGSVNAFL